MSRWTCALLVDDARFMRAVLRSALEPLFASFCEAGNRETAVAAARSHRPELITLDLSLDALEPAQGLAALPELRQASPASRIIVISALDQDWIREEARKGGAAACVKKPFAHESLRRLVEEVLCPES